MALSSPSLLLPANLLFCRHLDEAITVARDPSLYARAELSGLKARKAVDAPCLWRLKGGDGL
jgi:hypothetical protein